jgi:hypothetical protein
MTTAPVASLPPLRRRLGSSAGGGLLLSLESFHFCACLRSILSASSRLRWSSSGGCFVAPLFAGGCFATAVVLVGFCFGRMLCRLGWLVEWMLCHLCCVVDLRSLDVVVPFCRFSSVVGSRFMGSWKFSPPLFLAVLVCCWVVLPLAWWLVSALIASAY